MVILLYIRKAPNFYSLQLPRCVAALRAVPLVLLLDNQLADLYRCISLLKIARTVSYRLYTIMGFLW
jgi:hypothetical protein